MGEFSRGLIERSGYAREGFAAHYDAYRPRPPHILLETLCRIARAPRPALVVDLGAGTGLSTREWSELADRVVGIEPNAAMVNEARRSTPRSHIAYVNTFANATGLDDACADIVTCSQSLHWMEPTETFAEAARILRDGGAFAAYDYDPAPLIDTEVDAAYDAYQRRRRAAREARGIMAGADRWPKRGHLERMRASGRFRFCRELAFHSVTSGTADSLIGFINSIGMIGDAPEEELRLDELEAVARRVLRDREMPFQWSYFVRFGVK